MKKILFAALLAGSVAASLNAADFDVSVSGSQRGIDGFSLSIGDYYRVPVQDVMVIERRVPREEVSVIYFLSRHSHRDVAYITDLRLRGLGWWDISLRLGLDPRTIFIVDSVRPWGPPYGKAYGHRNNGSYHLGDHEIVDLVNVRFLSDYHRIRVDDIIDRRRKGEQYYIIDNHYRAKKVYPQERKVIRHEYREEHQGERREGRVIRRDDRSDKRDDRVIRGGERQERGERGNGPWKSSSDR